ncbi:aldose epimerase [alpha proteobacterium AAP81b]|nr:aldose epimerase [alpha proteobacterium AAP81b]
MIAMASKDFGSLPDSRRVERLVLHAAGIEVAVLTLGATLQSVRVPDARGLVADVALGFADLAGYLGASGYVGASIGRVANRIAGGRFRLDGQDYRVPCNNGANSLHGGSEGFDRRVWEVVTASTTAVRLRLVSPHGDQFYPGELTVTADFAVADGGMLTIDYRATTDRPTLVNLTTHAYWNLAGEGSGNIDDHVLTCPADAYTPVDAALIPTGAIASVAGTPFDFRTGARLGDRIHGADPQLRLAGGIDHNLVFARQPAAATRRVARLADPASGRTLELWSNQPGLQVYSGNFLDGSSTGKSGRAYARGAGIALEPQMFPDTANRPDFGSLGLAPGEVYAHAIRLVFGAE